MSKGLKVLSLFDGMSCGQIALERAGIEVDEYYASEIDKYAMQITMKNYPKTIQLGSVIDLEDWELPEVDLLIGGSPCQGFSVSGKLKGSSTKCGVDVVSLEQYLQLKDEGFEFEGQSYLFWEYVRIWKICKPKYFFLENVRVTKKWLPMFNKAMGVEPIMVNSALVSAQNRVRFYWTNIPGIEQPEDKGILLKDILEGITDIRPCELKTFSKDAICHHIATATDIKGQESLKRVYANSGKAPTLTTMQGGHRQPKVLISEASALTYAPDGGDFVDPYNKTNLKGDKSTALRTNSSNGNMWLKVPEATKKGYIEVKDGECFDYAVPNSKTRRGRMMKDKSNCLQTTNGFMQYTHPTYRKLTPLECERLQTVPDGYTEGVSNSQRYKMLGNGWTVDVAVHLFKGLLDEEE